ncbi:dynein regulatory complex subunit 7 isoform X6 [Archocentrus centrarchus]|uniref:dynein regulatory complex subunit 7 isoform X6 n=1 Tax=Archocentrus centrarchus TaxID=63155 RepID=UPI0011EA35CF|nr:dynein regulatory complex subunit 7 isoform X6 [Archocentrus centrarchus]
MHLSFIQEDRHRSRALMQSEDVSAPEELLPKSYRSNSPEEIRLLAMADSFQRQYSHLCPDRTPLLLCPVNECGVKKFVSTSLRPTSTVHCELFSWQGCASFVADSLSLVPLDPPVHLPKHLFSPTAVLQSQRATCFEYATLLCSLLLGENYDAYCVSGYAVKEMCVLDQSLQECPLLDTEVKAVTPEQKQRDNKYSAKLQLEQKSHFLAQREKKKQEAEAALLEKQKLQEEDEPNVFEMPRSWVRYIAISHEAMENRFPGGEKVIRYKQAQLERFAPRRRSHGLVTRLTKYKDRDCTEVTVVKEWYQDRSDFLLEKEVNNIDRVTTEIFSYGSKYHLQLFRVKHLTVDTEVEMHFSSAHADGVVQRVLSKTEMMELFEGRRDFLCYRHVCFREHIQEFYERPEELHILKVVERFHRNSSKPASDDVAERVFLEPERLIEVTYHLTKDQSVPSKISFIKPLESEKGKAQEFSLDMISTFQVDLFEKPFTAATLREMMLGLMEAEEEVSYQIALSVGEVKKIVTCKEKSGMKVWSRAQADPVPCCDQETEEIDDILPQQEHLSEEETDSQDEQDTDLHLDFSKNEEKAKLIPLHEGTSQRSEEK